MTGGWTSFTLAVTRAFTSNPPPPARAQLEPSLSWLARVCANEISQPPFQKVLRQKKGPLSLASTRAQEQRWGSVRGCHGRTTRRPRGVYVALLYGLFFSEVGGTQACQVGRPFIQRQHPPHKRLGKEVGKESGMDRPWPKPVILTREYAGLRQEGNFDRPPMRSCHLTNEGSAVPPNEGALTTSRRRCKSRSNEGTPDRPHRAAKPSWRSYRAPSQRHGKTLLNSTAIATLFFGLANSTCGALPPQADEKSFKPHCCRRSAGPITDLAFGNWRSPDVAKDSLERWLREIGIFGKKKQISARGRPAGFTVRYDHALSRTMDTQDRRARS